jgi:hypothetical protein
MFTNGYVAQQVQHFGLRRRVADEQPLGMDQNDQEGLFLQLSIHERAESLRNSRTSSDQESGRSFRLTIEMVNIHTCRYVKRPGEEAKEP